MSVDQTELRPNLKSRVINRAMSLGVAGVFFSVVGGGAYIMISESGSAIDNNARVIENGGGFTIRPLIEGQSYVVKLHTVSNMTEGMWELAMQNSLGKLDAQGCSRPQLSLNYFDPGGRAGGYVATCTR